MLNSCSESPRVSIIVPCYNHAPYVATCLKSIAAQSYQNCEVFIFDDGSRDGSADIIAPLAEQFGYFFRSQKNQGLSRTLNDALAMAEGEYIAPFASDDVMYTDRLEKQVKLMQSIADIGIASGQVTRIDEHGNTYPKQASRPTNTRYLTFDDLFLGRSTHPAAPTMLYRRKAIEQVGGFRDDIAIEDLYMQLKITGAGWRIADTPDLLAYYRVHSSNTMRNVKFLYDNIGKIYDEFQSHPAYPSVRRKYLNGMLLRAASADKPLAKQIWRDMQWSDCNVKTLRALIRLYWLRNAESRV